MKKFFLFLTLLTLSVGQMWATDPSVSVTSGSFSTSGTIGSIFPYTIVQNSGTNAPYTTSGNLRMYWQSSGSGQGNKFTITVPDGYTITGVTITASSGYTPTVKYNIDGGSDVTGTWSSTTMTISSISATSSFAFRNANTSNTQLRPTNVTVYYTTATPAKAYKVSFSTGDGNSPVAARTESSAGAGITLPSTSDLTPACSGDGWVLYGWTTATYGSASTTTAPTTTLVGLAGATYYPTDDITLHAVYKRAEGLAGTTMWSENFTGLSANAQPTSPSANGSQVYNSASVTYTCQTSYTKIYAEANAGGTSPEMLVPQSSRNGYFRATGVPTGGETSFTLTYRTNQSGLGVATTTSGVTISAATGSNPYTRTITTNSSSISSFILTFSMSTSSNARLDDISVVANGTCYYWSAPTCCTKLGSINGSVNVINPKTTEISWNNIANVSSWTVKYKVHSAENWSTHFTGKTGANPEITIYSDGGTNNKMKTTIATACNTLYDFQIIANPASNYCDKDETLNNSGSGYNSDKWSVSYSLSGVTKSDGPNEGNNVCGDFSATFAASSNAYELPTTEGITVTIDGNAYTDYTWNQATGVLTIDDDDITGAIAISCTATLVGCTADPTIGTASLSGAFSSSEIGVTVTGCSTGANTCAWTDYGFVWGTSANPTGNKTVIGTEGSATSWNGSLAGTFTADQTYYFRAYGQNSKNEAAIVYGADATFTPRSVTFKDGSSTLSTVLVNSGAAVAQPANPSKTGYDFVEWQLSESAYDFAFAVNSSIELQASWEKQNYSITKTFTGCTASLMPASYEYTGSGSDFTYTIAADDNYVLPATITVTMGGEALTANTDYTWDSGNGELAISKIITGNLVITITAAHLNTVSLKDRNNTLTQTTVGGNVVLPTRKSCTGYTFAGWSTTYNADWTTTAPTIIPAGDYVPTADVDLYPVYTKTETGATTPNAVLYYEPFTGSANSTAVQSTNVAATTDMFVDGSATVWSHYTFDAASTTSYAGNLDGEAMSNETKIKKEANTTVTMMEVKGIKITNASNMSLSLYNRRSYTTATLKISYKIDDGEYTEVSGIVYANNNDTWKLCDGLSISGTGNSLDLKIELLVSTSTNRTMTLDDIKIIGSVTPSTTSYISVSECCDELATLDGGVTLTNDGCAAGQLKATWKSNSEGLAGITSQVLHIYKEIDDSEVTAKKVTGLTASTENQTQTISGLETCTAYYVTVENISAGGFWCANGLAGEKSDNVTTKGYTYAVALTDNHATKKSGGANANTCAGNYEAIYEAITGWALPSTISVINAGTLNNGYTWDQATGALVIDASKVTDDVTVTITATEAPCTALTSPSVTVSNKGYPYDAVTLSWSSIENADGYTVEIYEGETLLESEDLDGGAESYTITTTLEHSTTYSYKLRATSETPAVHCPSEWATAEFETLDYPYVHVTYSENGITTNANTSAEPVDGRQLENAFALPSSVSNECTKVFVGWTDASPYVHETSDFYAPSANYTIHTNEDVTLYAVYATETPGDEIWTETAISDLTASDVVVIVGNNGNAYAMTNDNGTSSAPSAVEVTVSGSNLTGTIAANVRWNISKSSDDYTIYVNGTTESWLYCTNTNNGVRVGTNDNKVFTIDGGYLKNSNTSRYVGIYSSSDWRCYNPMHDNIANQTFKYYKRGVGAPTYSAYATTCTGKVKTPTFSDVTDSETYEIDKTVSLACETTGATIRYTMSNDGTTPADPTGESTAATSITLNADGIYVIKAKAFKDGMDASDVATITVTINKPCTTIAQYLAAAQASDKKLVFTSESNAVVLGVNANRIYIQDLTGGLLLYQTEHGKSWTKGMKVVGTVIGSYALVDNTPRMVVSDIDGLNASAYGVMPSPVVIEGAIDTENFAANRNKLVTVNSLHFQAQSVGAGYSINITRGEDTYQVYNAFNTLNDHVLPLTETACSVTGILGYHSNKYQLMPIEANCITTGATATMPEFVGETGGADVDHPTQVASGEVIKLTAAEGMTTNYQIGENAPVSVTTNTEAVISGSNNDIIVITISASREYYTNNSATHYYKINNALTKYIISSADAENGTFKVKNSDASAEITSSVAGATITLVAIPTHTDVEQYSLNEWTVYETGNTSNTVPVSNNQFEMPGYPVTVSATFVEDAYATVVFDGGDATGDAPASVKKYVGQEVTMPNKGALVKADHVLAGWTYNETDYEIGDPYEIQADDAAAGGKNITFAAKWTPYPWAAGGDWVLVTDVAELTEGSYVIIAASASNYAMSTTQNNNNRGQQSISKSENTLTYTTAPAIFEVRAGNTISGNPTLAFYDVVNNGYIYAAGGGNYLRTENSISDKSSWDIEVTNAGVATILAHGGVSQNDMRHNSNSSIFSCYTSGQADISLYKYYAPVPKVTYDKNTTDEVTNMPNPSVQRAENNKAVIASGPSRTGYSFEGWNSAAEGNGDAYTVGQEYTFTEDITLYAQWDALPTYSVTYVTVGTAPTDANEYNEGALVTLASASGLSNPGYVFNGWSDGTQVYAAEYAEYAMPDHNVTFTATWAEISSEKWVLVTHEDALEIDGEYAIVSTFEDNNHVMQYFALGEIVTMGSNKAGKGEAVTRSGNIVRGSTDMVTFTLKEGSASGKYAFKNGDNYLTWSNGNTLDNDDEVNANSSWTITIGEEDDIATIANVADNTRKLQYNAQNPRFACYTSAQKAVQLFKKAKNTVVEDATETKTSAEVAGGDIIVGDNGNLTINVSADKEAEDLTIKNGGTLTLTGDKTLTVKNVYLSSTMAGGKSSQMIGTLAQLAIQGEVYIDITLGAGGIASQWHAFTVPFPVDSLSGIYDLENKPLANEVNYAIMEYHGDIRATGNYGWKKYRKTLVPGTFYLMTVDGERTTYRFKKTADGALVAGNTKDLEEYPLNGGTEEHNDNGWNGVGNPTLRYGQVAYKVQVLNPTSYTYEPFEANETNFVVGTPFFIQAAEDGTMTFAAASGSANYAPARQAAKEIKDVKVTFGNEEYSDRLYISASEDALNQYETGKDLAKMTMTNTPSVAQIFGKAYNTKLCMINTPLVNNNAEVALDLYAPAAGEYTIAVPETADAQVYLTQNGHIIWNLSAGAYVAELQKGTTSEYGLKIVAAPQTPTGVEQSEVSHQPSDIQKIIINDNVFILRGEQMFDVTGKAVK